MTKNKFLFSLLWLATAFFHAGPLFAQFDSLVSPQYRIVIDPGHGGVNNGRNDDKWDPVTKAYLEPFAMGMQSGNLTEHETVLQLSTRVRYYLNLTNTSEGWEKFQEILKAFSPETSFRRIRFDTYMTRTDGWNQRNLPPENSAVNAPYRLYNFPDTQTGEMQPGRISNINRVRPYLVLSLHMNPAEGANPGGMAAVLSPGYRTFNLLREITLGRQSITLFRRLKWYDGWLVTDDGWNRFESARADAWVYFHGYRSLKNGSGPWKNRGVRQNMVFWRYADPEGWEEAARKNGPGPYSIRYRDFRPEGPFWDRERSDPELWRREDGPLGYGGDNHYACDELMRFVQYGVRLTVPEKRSAQALGPIQTPFVSTYSIPTFINAISAYLEIGFLNRERDRQLIIGQREATAKSLAVGIYSLFAGLSLRNLETPYRPTGKPLDFARYEKYREGNYFELVSP